MIKHHVLDDIGFVELLDHMGSDLTIVNAARISYANESAEFDDRDKKLLNYLMKHGHGTPFEHVVFSLRVKAPLFVVAQWERHRMATYNEESARYIEMPPEFYNPGDKHILWHSKDSYRLYENLMKQGMPKEQARMVLPQNLYKTFWCTWNARSVMNFIWQRNAPDAQKEMQEYGQAVEDIFAAVLPNTYDVFNENGRVAP